MEFMVERTSIWGKAKPCEEAYKKKYIRQDIRNADDPRKIPAYRNKTEEEIQEIWYNQGKNHRVEYGNIIRDFDDEAWFIEINNLEELINFTEKYGDIVFGHSIRHKYIIIEIYDNYRE